jgi:hypothetical protein
MLTKIKKFCSDHPKEIYNAQRIAVNVVVIGLIIVVVNQIGEKANSDYFAKIARSK